MTEAETTAGRRPRELFEAIGELAMAIAPHNMDRRQRARISEAIGVLVDHVLAHAHKDLNDGKD